MCCPPPRSYEKRLGLGPYPKVRASFSLSFHHPYAQVWYSSCSAWSSFHCRREALRSRFFLHSASRIEGNLALQCTSTMPSLCSISCGFCLPPSLAGSQFHPFPSLPLNKGSRVEGLRWSYVRSCWYLSSGSHSFLHSFWTLHHPCIAVNYAAEKSGMGKPVLQVACLIRAILHGYLNFSFSRLCILVRKLAAGGGSVNMVLTVTPLSLFQGAILFENFLCLWSSYIRTKVYQDSPYNIEMGFRGLSLFFLIVLLVYNHSPLFDVTPNTLTNLASSSGTGKTYGGWSCCCQRMRESDNKRSASLPSSFIYFYKIAVRECWLTPPPLPPSLLSSRRTIWWWSYRMRQKR